MNAGIYITVWLLVFGCRLLVFGCRLLVFGCRSLVFGCRYWLPAKATDNRQPTTDNRQPTSYNLLSIDILFLNNQTTSFVWKTVPCRCMLIAFFICFGTVFQTALSFLSLIPRLRPGIHESGCYMAGWHNVVINMVLLANYLKHMKK